MTMVFRVIRRNGDIQRPAAKCEVFENFDAWPTQGGSSWTHTTAAGNWSGSSSYIYVKKRLFERRIWHTVSAIYDTKRIFISTGTNKSDSHGPV